MATIVHYSPRYEEAHYEFASRHWSKRKRTTAEYVYWKFRGRPGRELHSFILALEGEKVVGQLGLIPCILKIGARRVEAQWACELMVDREHRGKGIARQLYDFAYALKPVTLGSDPSAAASVSMSRAGFVSTRGPVKFLFPLYLGEITKLKGINIPLLDKVPNPFLILFSIWSRAVRGRRFKRIAVDDYLEGVNKNFDGHDDRVRVEHENGFADWRFAPFKDYYSGIEPYGDDKGTLFSIYRHPRTYILTEHSAPRFSSLLTILGEVIGEARRNGARRIKMLADEAWQVRSLTCLGLVRFRTRAEIIFYCADPGMKQLMMGMPFHYTYLDSDENI